MGRWGATARQHGLGHRFSPLFFRTVIKKVPDNSWSSSDRIRGGVGTILRLPVGRCSGSEWPGCAQRGAWPPVGRGTGFLYKWIRIRAATTASAVFEELKSHNKEIKQVASKGCPAPFLTRVTGSFEASRFEPWHPRHRALDCRNANPEPFGVALIPRGPRNLNDHQFRR